MFNNPSLTDYKSYFVRDFNFGVATNTVQDVDVTNALQDAIAYVNQGLFASQEAFAVGCLNLAAHFMVMSLRASSQGIAGQYNFLQGGKGVGPASESFAIPQRILDNPALSMLCKTNYGAKFLMLVLPNLGGAMFTTWSD